MRTDVYQVMWGCLPIQMVCHYVLGYTRGIYGKLLKIVEKMRGRIFNHLGFYFFIADHIRADGGEFIVGLKMGSMSKLRQEEYFDLSKFVDKQLAFMETTPE